MSRLPREIEEDILLRLPVKSILCFKSVCKSWYSHINSPKFVDDHLILTKKNPRIMIRDSTLLSDKNMFYSIDYTSISTASASLSSTTCNCDGAVLMDYPIVKNKKGVEESRFIKILGSCNGLLCLGASDSDMLILWNPSTKEYMEIILPADDLKFPSYGFGYESKNNDYKLVCIAENQVYVYTLKSNSWRRVDTISYKSFCEWGGLLLYGVLHWTWKGDTNTIKHIVSFDISSEKFMNLPLPKELLQLPKRNCCGLRVLGDSLCIVGDVFNDRVDVWVMQNYGVGESWNKRFTTNQASTTLAQPLTPYWYFKNGEILLQDSEGFVLYDLQNERIRFLNFDGIDSFAYLESKSYVESLVSLTSGTYTEKRKRKRKRGPNPEYCEHHFYI